MVWVFGWIISCLVLWFYLFSLSLLGSVPPCHLQCSCLSFLCFFDLYLILFLYLTSVFCSLPCLPLECLAFVSSLSLLHVTVRTDHNMDLTETVSLEEQFKVCSISRRLNSAITGSLEVKYRLFVYTFMERTLLLWPRLLDLPLEAHNVTVNTDLKKSLLSQLANSLLASSSTSRFQSCLELQAIRPVSWSLHSPLCRAESQPRLPFGFLIELSFDIQTHLNF